jgi:DNA-binding LytR/AlgR family response regulator
MTISEGNRPASTESVEPPWDNRLRPADGRSSQVTSGGWRGTIGRLASRYGWVALLIVASCVVNVLTALQHTSDGISNLHGPILDESTSAFVLIMLLPILKRSVDAFSSARDRRVTFIFVAMAAVAYALLHVTLIALLRQMAYPAFGGTYEFHWRAEFATEVRKDLISAFMIVVVFWLIDRRPGARSVATADGLPAAPARGSPSLRPEIWLKDGSASIRVDPTVVISVISAGNYVEFALPDRRHLVRGTLAAEEIRLKPFGFSRVHRTRLVNSSRIAVIEPRPNGDFALRMDNGEVIAGSRRYKDAVVAIRAAGRQKE